MKVLLTGASGFLGGHIAERLVLAGHSVRALVRKTSNRKLLDALGGVEFAMGSVEERVAVDEAVRGVDAIIHSAALVKARSDREFEVTNVEGTRNVAEAARAQGGIRRFVQISSLEAAGPSGDGESVRHDQDAPVTRYGRSKLAADRLLLAMKDELPVTILRPGGIYGPRDQEILEAFRSVKRGVLPITGDGKTRYSIVYGPDCAELAVKALETDVPSGSVFFVSDGEVYSQRAMMEAIEAALGKRAMVRFGLPLGLVRAVSVGVEAYGKARDQAVMLTREKAAALGHHWVCDADEARRTFAWSPTLGFAEGAKKTASWYRDNGWL